MRYIRNNIKGGILLGGLVIFAAIQFIQPDFPRQEEPLPVLDVPEHISTILRTSCYNCHSNETELNWFDRIAPASWLVSKHINAGREALNFSTWDTLAPEVRVAKLYYSLNKVVQGEMPLSSYTMLNPDAKLSSADIDALKTYLAGLTVYRATDAPQPTGHRVVKPEKKAIRPAPNGIEYIDDYRHWKAISTTERFDNHTVRIIYGNDIAVDAIQRGDTNPWPKGTTFAKVAWASVMDSAGIIRPGSFKQVEFMIKDPEKYRTTKGWGWARWRGNELKPYGGNALFTTECINCHRPLKHRDFVFTKPFSPEPIIDKP